MRKFDKRGLTRYEFVSLTIIAVVIIAILLPLWLAFLESECRDLDGIDAVRAEDVAMCEYILHHYEGGETIAYMFTGDTEVLQVLRHWNVDGVDFDKITAPRFDGYDDGMAHENGTENKARSREIGDTPLYVVIQGEVVYNSWRDNYFR